MKVLFALGAIFLTSSTVFANINEVASCHSENKTHKLTLLDQADSVDFVFEEKSDEDLGKTSRGNYKVSGTTTTRRTIHGIRLPELTHKSDVISESLVSIMRSRQEFDGDADLHYAYANELIKAMHCK